MTSNSRVWTGVILVLIGALLLLDSLRVLDFGSTLSTYWPLLFVIWGVLIIFRKRRTDHADREPTGESSVFGDVHTVLTSETLRHSNVFGDLSVRVTTQGFRGGTVSAVFGDTTIDLHETVLAEGEQTLTLNGVFGDCSVRLPRDVPYAIAAHSVFGSLRTPEQRKDGISSSINFDSPGFMGGSKRLKVNVSQVFGDLMVEV